MEDFFHDFDGEFDDGEFVDDNFSEDDYDEDFDEQADLLSDTDLVRIMLLLERLSPADTSEELRSLFREDAADTASEVGVCAFWMAGRSEPRFAL